MKKIFLLSLIVIASMILLLGCDTKQLKDRAGEKELEEKQPLIYEEAKDSIKFNIMVNQKDYNLNDEIVVTALATNIGKDTISYYAGSSSCVSHLSIQIVSKENGRKLAVKPPEDIKACTEDIYIEQLEPGETVEENVIFLPKELIQSSEIQPAGGIYEVVVMFRPEGSNWEDSINAKTEIAIAGNNKKILSEEEVEQIVKDNISVQEWIENHTGEKIAKIENGEYFLLWYDGWHKTDKEEFDRMKQGVYQQEKQIRFVEGIWEVSYFSKLGLSPSKIKIIVDASSKEILSVETFE